MFLEDSKEAGSCGVSYFSKLLFDTVTLSAASVPPNIARRDRLDPHLHRHTEDMEHLALSEEMSAMSTVDFIVPLKQVGIISRSVLEAIHEFYRPRRIIVVTKKVEGEILNRLLPYWRVGPVQCIDEDTFFIPNFGLTFEAIVKEYDPTRPGKIKKRQ